VLLKNLQHRNFELIVKLYFGKHILLLQNNKHVTDFEFDFLIKLDWLDVTNLRPPEHQHKLMKFTAIIVGHYYVGRTIVRFSHERLTRPENHFSCVQSGILSSTKDILISTFNN
jgi:hypothetical protein